MHKILQSYLRRLTNLTGNNRSILLLRLTYQQFIDVHDFDFLTGNPSFTIIEELIARKKKISLCPIMDSRDESSNQASRRLKRLQRIDNFIYEEGGARDLYVGWPFIKGKFSDGTLVRAPLVFFPVSIQTNETTWKLHLRADVSITLNKSFLLAYAYFNHVKVDEDILEKVFDDYDPDSTVFRTELYQFLKDSPVELNFNQENFADKLHPFHEFKKPDFEKQEKNGELKLFPEAVLGIFPQAGSHLVPDYMELIENKIVNDLEEFFAFRTLVDPEEQHQFAANPFAFLNKVREEYTFTPFKMDAFQENAIKAIKMGNSMVVQGPPGTGKSQLICNLISDFVARGKKVLLVSQKRAALDVVYRRLYEKDISDFIGLVHDFKNDRKAIYEKIANQIDRIPEFKLKNNSLDAIQLERKFSQGSRRIDQITEEFEEFKQILYDESECGLSVKELYLTSDLDGKSIDVKQEYRHFKFDELSGFLVNLRSYADYAVKFSKADYPLRERKSFSDQGVSGLKRMEEILEEIPRISASIHLATKESLGTELNLEDAENILAKWDKVEELLELLKPKGVYRYFPQIAEFPDSETDLLWFSNTERVLLDCFSDDGMEKSLKTEDLGNFQVVLQNRLSSRKGLVPLVKWMFSKDKDYFKKVLGANGLSNNKNDILSLTKKIDNRLNFEHNLTKLRTKTWIQDIPKLIDKRNCQIWFSTFKNALKAKLVFTELRNFKDYFHPASISYDQLCEKLIELHKVIKEIPSLKQSWLLYFTENQINWIVSGGINTQKFFKVLRKDFDALCEFDKLKETFNHIEINTVTRLFEESEDYHADKIEQLFQNSLRLAWIEHIETKYPILRSVSSKKFQKLEAELQANVRDKLKISNDIVLLRARERTYQDVEYNRLNNMVTYRDLKHQVTKKKRIWPLRKLIANFADELFDLLPCWMASPESVSALFPMRSLFDLVVFDEASQAFAESGIPAMYRGNQIVIAGDNKQLRPNDLYMSRWDEEFEEPDLEVDSLLELAEKYLMNVQLMGHYRSQSLDLIDFSNQHFYKGKLKLLPDSKIVNAGNPAIKYIKVEGVWDKNINDTEAYAVCSLVMEIAEQDPDKSIGVVTFNAPQQMHIMDVLEEEALEKKISLPSSLFVKNIESVQGDEKDIIIFSTGYARDKNGRLIMQFGSLNQSGGENRLNVAITRAREKIFIVSSLYPQQLKTESLKNEGPKLLKAYLQYALEISEGKFIPSPSPGENFRVDWYLKQKIQNWANDHLTDCQIEEGLPFTDLTIKKNDQYIGLLLTDDDLYYQSASMKEMHVYRPFTMSSKHWKFTGFWSREYWHDKQSVQESIQGFINLNS